MLFLRKKKSYRLKLLLNKISLLYFEIKKAFFFLQFNFTPIFVNIWKIFAATSTAMLKLPILYNSDTVSTFYSQLNVPEEFPSDLGHLTEQNRNL